MSTVIVSPKCTSISAKYLAETLDIEHHVINGSVNLTQYDKVINWGSSEFIDAKNIVNNPLGVHLAVNKLTTFAQLKDKVPLPLVTKDQDVALEWLKKGYWVVCREFTSSSKSKGTTIVSDEYNLRNIKAKFYTSYIPHNKELRVNVFRNKIVTVLEKQHSNNNNEFSFKYLHGYKNKDLSLCVPVISKAMGLDFYGLDVLLMKNDNLCVLEVNSAPTLFGITATKMANLLQKELV